MGKEKIMTIILIIGGALIVYGVGYIHGRISQSKKFVKMLKELGDWDEDMGGLMDDI